jgi:hypothetical protein
MLSRATGRRSATSAQYGGTALPFPRDHVRADRQRLACADARFRRLTVRGSAGELHNDVVVPDDRSRTLVRTPLVRRQTGYDLDLIGYDTEHISFGSELHYRNPYPGRRWMDDEIAMATLLERMASWVRGDGPEPYPLTEGAQDQQIALAIEQSADSDTTVTTSREPWS